MRNLALGSKNQKHRISKNGTFRPLSLLLSGVIADFLISGLYNRILVGDILYVILLDFSSYANKQLTQTKISLSMAIYKAQFDF